MTSDESWNRVCAIYSQADMSRYYKLTWELGSAVVDELKAVYPQVVGPTTRLFGRPIVVNDHAPNMIRLVDSTYAQVEDPPFRVCTCTEVHRSMVGCTCSGKPDPVQLAEYLARLGYVVLNPDMATQLRDLVQSMIGRGSDPAEDDIIRAMCEDHELTDVFVTLVEHPDAHVLNRNLYRATWLVRHGLLRYGTPPGRYDVTPLGERVYAQIK